MNVTSINVLLRGAILSLGFAVIAELALNSYDAWTSYEVAGRIFAVAETAKPLFTALPNLRTDRNNTERDLLSTVPKAPNPRVIEARQIAILAFGQAASALGQISFENGASQTARFWELLRKWQSLHDIANDALKSPRSQRPSGLPDEYVRTSTDLIDQSDRISLSIARSVKLDDPFVEKMFDIKNAAWSARGAAGDISSVLTAATVGVGLPKDAGAQIIAAQAHAESDWQTVLALLDGMDVPEHLKDVIATAKRDYFATDVQQQISSWRAELERNDGKISISSQDYNAYMIPRLARIIAIADTVLDVAKERASESKDAARSKLFVELGAVLGAIVFVASTLLLVGRRVLRPLRIIRERMIALANGDLKAEAPYAKRKDEIGALGQAMATFKVNMVEAEQLRADAAEHDRLSAELRRTELRIFASRFNDAIGNVVSEVVAASSELQQSAQTLSAGAEQTSQQSVAVASASEEASSNVAAVAESAQMLSTKISEISREVAHSAEIAIKAVADVQQTNSRVKGLAGAADKIGSIVGLINEIAGKTNLLALNATIEAARAGNAGKGFAVVASEVKQLADQTSRATAEISDQVGAIQSATADTAAAINTIGETIVKMNGIAESIAEAIDAQGEATREIARNVREASRGTEMVSYNISGVTTAASESSNTATQVLGSAITLNQQAEELRKEVAGFLASILAS